MRQRRRRWLAPVAVALLWAGAAAAQEDEPLVIEGVAEEAPGEPAAAEPAAASDEPIAPADRGEAFISAHRAYEEGDYGRAVELYGKLVRDDPDNELLLYNLGNAYLRNGELGRAIASYRRSRLLAPRNGDVRANLEFARKSTKDAIAPPEPSAALATLFFWHYELSRAELAALAVVANLLLWTTLALRLRYRDWEPLRWLPVVVLLPFLAASGSLALRTLAPERVAVVVPQEVDAFTAPDGESVVRFKLHAGTELRVRDRRDGWVRIELPDGQQGWLAGEWVELVRG